MSKRAASQELEHDPVLAKKFAHFDAHSNASVSSIQSFALSILENRSLAQYVRKVTLTCSTFTRYPTHAPVYTATTAEGKAKNITFKAAIAEQQWPEPDATELLNRLMAAENGDFNGPRHHELLPDAAVALLLPLLPNLEHWVVGEVDRPEFVGKAVQRAKDGIFGSISIAHIEIRPRAPFSDAAWDDISWKAFNIYANLPALQSIKGKGIGGHGVDESGAYADDDGIPSQACAVREIHLRHMDLPSACLVKIIGFSTALEAFTYCFGGRAGDGGTDMVHSVRIAKALSAHRLTMRELNLDAESQLYHDSIAEEMQEWMDEMKEEENEESDEEESDEKDSDTETLNSENSEKTHKKSEARREATQSNPFFPNLTRLRIGIKLALRFVEISGKQTLADWLPASLEELVIVGYRHHETGAMAEVVRRREELFPNLRVLKGIEEYIEVGKELENEDDYVDSEAEAEETDSD